VRFTQCNTKISNNWINKVHCEKLFPLIPTIIGLTKFTEAAELTSHVPAGRYYYNAVFVTENHLHFVNGLHIAHIACKRLANLYKFRVHIYRPLVRVSAVCSLQWYDTDVGW